MKTIELIGKYAVITGATCGIGKVYATEFARAGYNLVITGRRDELLHRLADDLNREFGVIVEPMILELSVNKDLKRLLTRLEELETIEVLVNNAGFGSRKKFFSDTFANQEKMLKVHINATSHITHRVVPKMIRNGGGTIINVSSLAAFTPLADNYFYCASKAFLVTFSESLYMDLRDKNIRVQALCPGFTRTEFHARMEAVAECPRRGICSAWMSPEDVVRKSLHAIQRKNKVVYVPGVYNNLVFRALKLVPRWFYYRVARLVAA